MQPLPPLSPVIIFVFFSLFFGSESELDFYENIFTPKYFLLKVFHVVESAFHFTSKKLTLYMFQRIIKNLYIFFYLKKKIQLNFFYIPYLHLKRWAIFISNTFFRISKLFLKILAFWKKKSCEYENKLKGGEEGCISVIGTEPKSDV